MVAPTVLCDLLLQRQQIQVNILQVHSTISSESPVSPSFPHHWPTLFPFLLDLLGRCHQQVGRELRHERGGGRGCAMRLELRREQACRWARASFLSVPFLHWFYILTNTSSASYALIFLINLHLML